MLTALLVLALQAADDFKPILNGKNLDGWKEFSGKKEALDGKTDAFGGRFKVVEGRLVIDPEVKGDVHIETAQSYGKDITIRMEVKAGPKCNNDLFFRGTKFDLVPGNKENKALKEGEWCAVEIVVTGDKIEHKVGGETSRTSTIKSETGATPFRIRAEFGVLEIRNLRVKE